MNSSKPRPQDAIYFDQEGGTGDEHPFPHPLLLYIPLAGQSTCSNQAVVFAVVVSAGRGRAPDAMDGDSDEDEDLKPVGSSGPSFLAGPELLPNLHIDDSELSLQEVSR